MKFKFAFDDFDTYINISSSFLQKNRCRHCSQLPSKGYSGQWLNRRLFLNPKDEANFYLDSRNELKRLCPSESSKTSPRYCTSVQMFNFKLFDKGHNPKLSRCVGIPDYNNDIVQYLACKCYRTLWIINTKQCSNSPDVVNRKGKYSYEKKFSWF